MLKVKNVENCWKCLCTLKTGKSEYMKKIELFIFLQKSHGFQVNLVIWEEKQSGPPLWLSGAGRVACLPQWLLAPALGVGWVPLCCTVFEGPGGPWAPHAVHLHSLLAGFGPSAHSAAHFPAAASGLCQQEWKTVWVKEGWLRRLKGSLSQNGVRKAKGGLIRFVFKAGASPSCSALRNSGWILTSFGVMSSPTQQRLPKH